MEQSQAFQIIAPARTRLPVGHSIGRGIFAIVSLLIALAAILGFLPASWLLSGVAGIILLAAWSAGAIAFVAAVSPRLGLVSNAVAFHEERAETRRAA